MPRGTKRQRRLHAINVRALAFATRLLRRGIKRILNKGEGVLFAGAVQYLMPKNQAEAEEILKAADAGDLFTASSLKGSGIDLATNANKLSFAQIQEAGLVFAADTFDEMFTTMFGADLDVLMINAAQNTGNAWIGTLNPDALENIQDVFSKQWLRENGLDLATDVSNSLKPQLREALARAITDNNVSVRNLKKELSKSLTDWEGWRLERLARTEGNAASSNGALESFRQSGVVDRKEWWNPDPQHESCILNNGQVVGLDDFFASGDFSPPAHPNCESSVLPVLA